MLRINKWRLQFANNLVKMLRNTIRSMVQEDINFTIKAPISYKMMVGWVKERYSFEGEAGTKVHEEGVASSILGV